MTELSGMALDRWERDPKLLGIMLARYKFVGKVLEGFGSVLEVGCNDGFGSRVVRQHVQYLSAIDIDPTRIKLANDSHSDKWPTHFVTHDIMASPLPGFDAVYCLDVFEHIRDEDTLLRNLRACAPVCIIGTPSIESQIYATDGPDEHVNCKTGADLKAVMQKHWKNVFLLGMNDELVHTGFSKMSHYLLALATA